MLNRLIAYQPPTGAGPFLMHYPHVFYNIHTPDDPRNLVPYAWQIVYGTPEAPVSHEISAATTEIADDVTLVRGERLTQTVKAVSEAMAAHDRDPETTTIYLLHIRSHMIRAIILRRSPIEESIVIPLAPIPQAVRAQAEWRLEEFLGLLREAIPPPPGHRGRGPNGERG